MAEPNLNLNVPIGGGGLGASIGAAVTEKLASAIGNMDIKSTLENMVSKIPEDEDAEEIRSKLKHIMEKLQEMSEEEVAEFTNQVKEGLMSRLGTHLEESGAINKIEDAISWAVWSKLYMLAAGVVLLIIFVVFFGYKLFKSIKEKEKKREEKKKAKQSKKKK